MMSHLNLKLLLKLLRLAAILISANGVEAIRFGDDCQTQRECISDGVLKVTGVICKWASSSCAKGVCTCDEDFLEDAENRRCRSVIKLGESCRTETGDQCGAMHAYCSGGICRCSTGFKPGPRGDDCIPAHLAALSYGESCYYRLALFHDAFCPYNMICTPSGCACPPGFIVNKTTNYDCIPINLGDPCATDVDCSQNLHAFCSKDRNFTCSCRSSFRLARYRYGGEIRKRCVRRDARFLSEGDYCGDAYPFGTPFVALVSICQEGLTCVSCYDTHSPSRICGVTSKDPYPTSTAIVKYEKRQRLLGERCDNTFRSECILPHTDCINGLCQCLPGTGCVFKDYETSGNVFDVRRNGALVGRPCSSDSDCARDGSMTCQSVSPTCSRTLNTNYGGRAQFRGVCACASPNYIERSFYLHETGLRRDTVSTCSRRLRIGEICSKSRTNGRGICAARYSDCIFGVCQCVQGYKVAPWSDECIPDEQIRYYGEKCLFSEECYYSQTFESPMACLDNTCGCLAGSRPGMTNPDGPAYGCVSNRLADRCMSDMDCYLYWRYNWHCSPSTQTCECNTGYYAAKLALRDGNQIAQWCVPYNATLRNEGESCRQTIEDIDISNVCAAPLVCTSCDDVYGKDGICGWPSPGQTSVPVEAMVTVWSASSSEPAKTCAATPIDDDLPLLIAPSHCFPGDLRNGKNTLTVEIAFRTLDGRNVSVEAESLLRHPVVDVALVRYKPIGDDTARNSYPLPPAIDLPTVGMCDELFNCTTSSEDGGGFLEIIGTGQCQQEYGVKGGSMVSQKTLCAGRYRSTVSSGCQLESSLSPLTCRNPNGRTVVAGLPVRLGQCAIAGMPRVFSRICYTLEWINQARMILTSLQSISPPRNNTSSSSSSNCVPSRN